MLNIVIPMAGAGSRFAKSGFELPKPLIPIHKVPMIQLVVENIRPKIQHRFIFIVQESHLTGFGLNSVLQKSSEHCNIVPINGITEGAACTVLKARDLIDNPNPLMIVNSDQYVHADIDEYLSILDSNNLDGLIMTMRSSHQKWSYVKIGHEGLIEHVVEKEVISEHATVGVYNFRRGSDFVAAAESMILNNQRSNGEFYVAPVYNRMIDKGMRVGCWSIGKESEGMYGLGTPEDLHLFRSNQLSIAVESKLFSRRNEEG